MRQAGRQAQTDLAEDRVEDIVLPRWRGHGEEGELHLGVEQRYLVVRRRVRFLALRDVRQPRLLQLVGVFTVGVVAAAVAYRGSTSSGGPAPKPAAADTGKQRGR